MKNPFLKIAVIALSMQAALYAQEFKLPVNLDKLADRATESVDVTLDSSMLNLASKFLSKDDPDEAQVKKLVSKLRGIYVRSFEFDKEGQYSKADIESVRAQLKGPNWSRIVGVKSIKGENAEVYLLKDGDQIGGIVVLAVEPKEFTVVHIDGSINPDDLSKLSGHLGIPEMDKEKKRTRHHDDERDKKDDDDQNDLGEN